MTKIKIIDVLKSLSADEIRQLDKFVISPFHNKHDKVVALFRYIRKNLNKGKEDISGEKIFNHLFPNEPVDMQKVHHVSSYLLKVVWDFLAWMEWIKDPVVFGLYLTRALSSRQLEKQFNNCLAKTRRTHKNQTIRDSSFYLIEYQLQYEEYNYARTLGRIREFNLQELTNSQDISFITERLKNACVQLSHQALTKTSYNTGLLDSTISFLQKHPFLEVPTLSIYYFAYMALSGIGGDSSFVQLKAKLLEFSHLFKVSELNDLYIHAINFCIKKLNSGNKLFRREVFDIYQSGLTLNVFLDKGVFSPWTYSNIVQVGLMLNEFETIESFINEYQKYLPENKREAYYSYNHAWFFYQKKDYSHAMQLLLRTDYGGDVLISCTAKTLLARMYFELNEMESLESLLKSFKMFIRRKKMLAYHKEPYLKFILFAQRMSIPNFSDKYSKETFTQEINTTNVAAKDWILEQIEKLGSANNRSLN